MKKFIIIIILSVLFTSCLRHYNIESSLVLSNTITDTYKIKSKYYTFEQAPIFNDSVENYLASRKNIIKNEADMYYNDTTMTSYNYIFESVIIDTVFMANESYISSRLTDYFYTGGAHGTTQFKSFNYDFVNQRMLNNEDILNINDSALINNLLVKHFENGGCFTENPSISLIYTLNISIEGLIFTFPQYELGAYVCGYKEIIIPMEEATDILKLKILDGKLVIKQ